MEPISQSIAAKIAENDQRETLQYEALHEALGNMIAMRKVYLKPNNRRSLAPRLLWAEWYYAKAMHDLYGDESTREMLDCACHELGVDDDGNECE